MLLPLAAAAAAASAIAALLQAAAPAAPEAPAPSQIVERAPAADWTAIGADDLLVMDLAPDRAGKPRRVVIQLLPAPFSRGWVGNIRTLAAAHWWDGTSVNRVQDNYVVQWGDASEKKPLPAGLVAVPAADYVVPADRALDLRAASRTPPAAPLKQAADVAAIVAGVNAEWIERYRAAGVSAASLKDAYAEATGHVRGWPVGIGEAALWPVHCYGMVGVGRNLSPDTGSGAELYTVIGHAPRHLDRNIALVGRVVEGIEHLSSLPRGTEALGFYKTAAERVPIVRVRLASALPAGERPRFEYLSTESATFAAFAEARANRRDAFFNVPAGGADVCNVPVPVRRMK